MTTVKTEFSAGDANPVVLYGKDNADAREAYPILRSFFSPGFQIPAYESILVTYSSGNPTHVYFISSGSTVASLLVTYSSGNPTHVYKV